jgi:hypothetical protein
VSRSLTLAYPLGRNEDTAREVFHRCYPAFEGIVCMDSHPFFGTHPGYGVAIRVEDAAVVHDYYLDRAALIGSHLRFSLSIAFRHLVVSHTVRTGACRLESRRADSNRFPAHYECAVQSPTMQGASPFYPLYNLDNSVL